MSTYANFTYSELLPPIISERRRLLDGHQIRVVKFLDNKVRPSCILLFVKFHMKSCHGPPAMHDREAVTLQKTNSPGEIQVLNTIVLMRNLLVVTFFWRGNHGIGQKY